ncbi:MAG: C_GCAxxG_C_C family protein [Tissierellia bacterium]|nr:C_GCAxxG_C_C family protein [Tissierellia bacterium]
MLYELIKSGYGNEENYNCTEKILYGANEAYKLNLSKEALKLSAAFGGGMGIESVCGALTGAVMVLSSKYVKNIAREDKKVFDLSKELFEKYETKMGSIKCNELKAKYKKEDIGCRDIILEATRVLDNIVKENL